jgi:hypothetical protein
MTQPRHLRCVRFWLQTFVGYHRSCCVTRPAPQQIIFVPAWLAIILTGLFCQCTFMNIF